MTPRLRVLVVDDSALMRRLIADLLQADPGIEVVGTASDGIEAMAQIAALNPDVVTLDVQMPRMSGLEVLQHIMRQRPLPVVMLSGLTDPDITLTALELGAVDFVLKPSGTMSVDLYKIRDELLEKVRVAVFADLHTLSHPVRPPHVPIPPQFGACYPLALAVSEPDWLVAVAASTGGPRALEVLVRGLPENLPAAVVIVQHMPRGFTTSLAKRLNSRSDLPVKEAEQDESVEGNRVYIAPAGRHLRLTLDQANKRVKFDLDDSPPVLGLRPAANVMMESAAQVYGRRCIGVVLTGMGSDGTRGFQVIKQHGGQTLTQDQSSSVVYGMPRSAVESGFADQVLSLSQMAGAIVCLVQKE
ncbi:MAG: protein-glutamate methylesterase/protein-glutamine glutaminase [Chloroflexota bacterium]